MTQLYDNLKALGAKRLALLAAAIVVTVGFMAALTLMMSRPSLVLLYSGLDPAVAGEVVRSLDEMKVAYEVKGDAILVAEAERDRARLALAEKGLPRRGQAGYELLDELSGFGVTTDMFDAAYWRAKEGELARTVTALNNVSEARVHLVPMTRETFSRRTVEPSASITVTTRDGTPLSRRQAQAIRHLVALAVKGLPPGRVTVVDTDAGVVLAPEDGDASGAVDDLRAERERQLRDDVERLLTAHLGANRLRVGVTVEVDNEAENVTERTFDPDKRVAVHTESTETEETSDETQGDDAVGVQGNLPNPDGGAANGDSARSSKTETRESANYEVSEVRRERRRTPGAVKRLSVAVLLGGVWEPGADGTPVWRAQSPAELKAIRELVQSAVGFDSARGDTVTVESLRFRDEGGTTAAEVEPGMGVVLARHAGTAVQALALAAIAFLVLWFVARPILNPRAATPAAEGVRRIGGGMTPVIGSADGATDVGEGDEVPSRAPAAAAGALPPPAADLPARERVLIETAEAVDRFPDEALGLLRRWLHDGGREAAS